MLFACQNSSIEENMDSEVADFLFTNESEEPFGLKDVSGEYWIAYFLYTDCKLVCPTTTPNMVSVQEGLQAEGIDTQIVAFTVDLEKDRSEEHTSELQSRGHLVCRLLLEKKKHIRPAAMTE